MLKAAEAQVGGVTFVNAIKRKGLAAEVAELIAWLLCDGSKFMSGTVQSIDGAWAC
jgi:NAD(P)-dependent dehydrogenase (short-subunit alcohol dehydrogenase family)